LLIAPEIDTFARSLRKLEPSSDAAVLEFSTASTWTRRIAPDLNGAGDSLSCQSVDEPRRNLSSLQQVDPSRGGCRSNDGSMDRVMRLLCG